MMLRMPILRERRGPWACGVSLLELIIAVVVLGIVAMVVVPRFGRAASAPEPGEVLRQHLRVLRVAIARYQQDHHAWPAEVGDDEHPPGSPEAFVSQLTRFTSKSGHVSYAQDEQHPYGPYLRDGVPPCPVPPCSGAFGVRVVTSDDAFLQAVADSDVAWIYDARTGRIAVNSSATDAEGRPYLQY